MKKFNYRLIVFGIFFCMQVQTVSPNILAAIGTDIVSRETDINTANEEPLIETTTEEVTEEATIEVPPGGGPSTGPPIGKPGETTEATTEVSTEVSTQASTEEGRPVEPPTKLPDINTLFPFLNLDTLNLPKADYDATIDLANAASLAQTGLGYMVSGTTSPNRILIFNAAAAGKSYRVFQSGTSRVDAINVSVGAGKTTHITLAGINLTRPRIDGTGTLEGSAFLINSGNCTIELEGNSKNVLKTTASTIEFANLTALTVSAGTSLTIEGTGELQATSSRSVDDTQSNAGIGGNLNGGGNITINSGTIIAKGDDYSAGIGSSMESTINSITINGGTITAIGGYEAAGIGTGRDGTIKNSILITGGTIVTSEGGGGGAGIGTGFRKTEEINVSYIDSIIIRGGNIKANGSTSGVGIGAANYGHVNLIDISGGDIEAKAALFGAGIGSGFHASTGDINISGGTIVATSNSCGIGTGAPAAHVERIMISGDNTVINASATSGTGVGIGVASNGSINKILITGGKKITATGAGSASSASATGSGIGAVSSSTLKEIEITGGNIVAKGTPDSTFFGVGIGSAITGMERITISGGTIEAVGGKDGAGIGAAVGNGTHGGIKEIVIEGGDITATGGLNGPGIGILSSARSNIIKINGGVIKATGGDGAAGIGTGVSTYVTMLDDIEIMDGTITAIGGRNGVGIGWAGETNANSTVGQVQINGGHVNAIANQNYGVGIGMAWRSGVPAREWETGIIIRGGTVIATGTDAGIGSRYNSSIVNIVLTGGNITASGGTLVDGNVTTKGPGIGYLYQSGLVPSAPLFTASKEATIRAFSTGTTVVNGAAGSTNISPAYKVGLHLGDANWMNFQIRDSKVNQATHDVYIHTDDPLYKGPLTEKSNSFYSFAYTTGNAPQTHSYRLIADGSDGSTKLGLFYEQLTKVDAFISAPRNQTLTILEVGLFPTVEAKLTPDVNLVKSGGIVTWTLTLKNTSSNAAMETVIFTPDFAAAGMQLVAGSVTRDGQVVPDQIMQGNVGFESIVPGQEATLVFKTTVTGVINQERVLSIDIGAMFADPWNVKNNVYIKNIDANYPNWTPGLGLWSVPKEFDFGYIDIRSTVTSASLNPDKYQSYTQSGGLYTRVYETEGSVSRGWEVKVALMPFVNEHNETDMLAAGTRLEMVTSLKQVKAPNQNQEMIGDPLGSSPPTLINSQIDLLAGAPAKTIIFTAAGADLGTWDLNIPINAVKLHVPSTETIMQGSHYQSKLTWSLEVGP